jgi:ribosomal protein S18 acetylase RimI-like enzyme
VAEWEQEAIGRHHDRQSFDCGVAAPNDYLRRYARQNHVTGGAKTFVAIRPTVPAAIMGYYSLSLGGIDFAKVPGGILQKLGRYDVPVFRLARLAVAIREQGRGVGSALLFAAAGRAMAVASQVDGVGLAIDAKDERAVRWYQGFGAVQLVDDPFKLILPFDVIAEADRETEKKDS